MVFGTLFCLAAIPLDISKGQQIRPPNYDESVVPKFELPSVLQSPIPLNVLYAPFGKAIAKEQ